MKKETRQRIEVSILIIIVSWIILFFIFALVVAKIQKKYISENHFKIISPDKSCNELIEDYFSFSLDNDEYIMGIWFERDKDYYFAVYVGGVEDKDSFIENYDGLQYYREDSTIDLESGSSFEAEQYKIKDSNHRLYFYIKDNQLIAKFVSYNYPGSEIYNMIVTEHKKANELQNKLVK